MWYERRRDKSAAREVFVFECRWAFQAWKTGAACLGEGDDGRVGHAKSGYLQAGAGPASSSWRNALGQKMGWNKPHYW